MVCRRIFQLCFSMPSSVVLLLYRFSLFCSQFFIFGENFRKASHGDRGGKKVEWRNTSLNKRYESSFFSPKGLENCSPFFVVCVALYIIFSGWSPRRQTSKITVWEISSNPREFLRFFSPFVFLFCPFFFSLFSNSSMFSFLFYVAGFFFGVITKNFYWRSSHHHYSRVECAFFVHFSSLSCSHCCMMSIVGCATWKKTWKIHSLIFWMLWLILRYLVLAFGRRFRCRETLEGRQKVNCTHKNRNENWWRIESSSSFCSFLFFWFTFHTRIP